MWDHCTFLLDLKLRSSYVTDRPSRVVTRRGETGGNRSVGPKFFLSLTASKASQVNPEDLQL